MRLSAILAALALASAGSAYADTLAKVTQQPASTTVEAGSPASFTSTATATPAPTVQWERSTDGGKTFKNIEGATSTTYAIASTTAAENGYEFRAVFRNGAGPVDSKPATLTVTEKPAITKQPADAFAQEGHEAVFESTASGSPAPTVQWQESTDGGVTYKTLAGVTTTTLHLTNLNKTMDGWKFHAVFKNSTGTVTSEAATLHIIDVPKIETQPLDRTVLEGQSAEFHTTALGNPPPTVQWELSTDGGSTFTPIEGATGETLIVPATTTAEDGYRYRAVWSNLAGTATTRVAKLTVHGIPKVTTQPQDTVVLAGGTATFEAQASGNPAPTVQWEMSTNGGETFSPIPEATGTTFSIASAQQSENGHLFRAVFTNVAGTTASEAALLTVSATDFRAYGWGLNKNGQAGTGVNEGIVPAPAPLPNLEFVTQVAAGQKFSLALRAGGTVESWGFNGHGQLGNEGAFGIRSPMLIENLRRVTAIAAGGNHSLALLADGTVKAWGDDEAGQLGDGSSTDSEVPVPVPGLSGVTAIAAGEEHSLALLSDGTVMAWGGNESGQLGTGNTNPSSTPVAVKGLSGVTAIAAGGRFSMALLSDGTVVAWGDDGRHELGNEAVALQEEEVTKEEEAGLHSNKPVPVDGLSGVKEISAGRNHALALLQNGTVMAWGDDSKGELGSGVFEETNDKASPVTGLSGVTAISAGERISAAVLSTGAVMTWGSNETSALGTGGVGEPSATPVQAHNIAQAVGVAAGGGHMLAFGEALPAVTKVSPREGPTSGGQTVTITGANFGDATAVSFGTHAATSYTQNSSNSITATAPAGTGVVDIRVTTPSGESAAVAVDRYTYRVAPTVTKLSAKGGPATGGTSVTISGTDFTNATAVSFGGVAATSYTVVTPFSITAVAPPNVGGTADVTVTTVGGTSAIVKKDQFRYAPVIEGVSPPNGPAAGGNTVTVTGAGFIVGTGTMKFKFGKGSSKSVKCTSSSSCEVLVPPAKVITTVDVTATAGKGKSTAVPADHYTYE
jgi:alpha-tubulin suppressor-like RCC1 family protein